MQFPASSCGHRDNDDLEGRKGLGYMLKQSFGKVSEVRRYWILRRRPAGSTRSSDACKCENIVCFINHVARPVHPAEATPLVPTQRAIVTEVIHYYNVFVYIYML